MKNYINKTLSLILSVILVLSVYVITDETLPATALENFKQEPMKPLAVGESYTFHFGEGDVIETVANSTTSVDLDGNEFKPFMSQNGNGVDTAVQANIDTNGDGVQDASTLKLSLTGWNSVYIPTDVNGHPLELEPNTTYNVSINVYIEAKSAYGQLFPGGGVKSQYAKSPYTGGGIIYDNNSVYYGGNISSLRTGSSTFTTGDYQVSNGKFTLDDTEYYNYFYLYNGLCSEKFDGTNLAPSVIYIDSITITKTKAPKELGYTETYEFDTVKTSTSADKEGNSFTPFMSQNGGGTDTATQVNLDIDGDGTPETSTLKLSLTGWNSVYIPTDENGYPFVLEPNTTYTVSIKVYIEAKSPYGQFFIGGGAKSQYTQSPYKSGGMIYDNNMVYYGGELSSLRTASSTFTTGDYQVSSGKFVLNETEYLNYMYIFTGLCSEKFDGVNTTPSVVYIDSVTVTKTAQTANITFDANDGAFSGSETTITATQSVGKDFTAEAPVSGVGTFAGWSYTANGMPIHKVTSAMNGKTLYAIYKNPVNIILNANGGSFESGATTVSTTQFDGVYLKYDTPTNNSAKFLGWATSPTATSKLANYQITSAMEGTTLYAVWEKKPHGSYSTFERVVDYSKYTVNAWSGGNTWWAGGNSQYPWFSIVSDNTADGGKYLRFKTPHDDDESGALANDWLGAYGITMTASGSYNATGSGDENLYLPENTSYRVTLKIRTENLSGGRMELYVAYGNVHHTAYDQKTTLISEIGEMDEWTEISAVFTTPAEYNGVNKLCFIGLTAGGSREFEYHLDSVKLERVTATNVYTVQGGTATLEKTVYGVPGTELTSEIKEEHYSSQDNTGYYKKITLGGKVFADKNLSEETVFKFANYDVDVYTNDFTKTIMGTENQEAFCGFDTYDNNDLAGFDVNCAEITDSMSYSGEKSLKINANTNTAFEIKNIDSLHLGTGKTYKITLWYKSESTAKLAVGTVDAENLTSRSLEAKEVAVANDFTKVSYLITSDKAYNEGYVPVVYAETGNSPLYIDCITVSCVTNFEGGYKTGNDDLRFVMSYNGSSDNTVSVDGNKYTVVERGIFVTGADNEGAVLEVGTTSKGVQVITTTDLSDNFDSASGQTLYSVLIDRINASDTYKFTVRGYTKLSNGEIYYSEIVNMATAEAKIGTPKAESTSEVLYNGIVIPENWPSDEMDKYGFDELPVPYLTDKPDVINIDVGRQLFVDDFLIAETDLNRTWHQAVQYEGNPIFKAETDIEKGLPYNDTYSHGACASPFSDGVWYDSDDGLYKMWYRAGSYYGTALATSKDGINWERGEYDVVSGTNLVLTPTETHFRDSNAIIINPFAKLSSEKYNMIQTQDPEHPNRLVGKIFTSADGIHWTYRTCTTVIGDRSTMFFNPFRNKWVFSIRDYWYDRSRNYFETNSLTKGTNLENAVHWLRADNKDLRDPVIGDKPQLYNVDAVAYESIMLGAFQIYLGPDNSITDATGIPKVTNIHLGFSRDGFHFSRSEDRTAFLSCSQEAGTWDRGYLTTNAGICMVNDDELWFYYTGFEGDESLTNTGSCMSSGNYANSSTGLAKLRRDGFASMNGTGTLVTEKITFSGKHLFVNANAQGGSVKAEILDENGNVVPGYSVNDCVALTEDTTKTMLSFGEGKDLSQFAAKNVKIRFYLDNAELYSFWVSTDAENGASNGYLAAGSVGQSGLIDTAESYK